MQVCIIGTGYVGLVTGACFAEMGNDVWCVDVDQEKIAQLNRGKIPIYEPGLEELVKRNVNQGRLRFSTCLDEALETSLVVFIAVGTPPNEDGTADLSCVLAAARDIGRLINSYKIIVTKSTVPVGTAGKIRQSVKQELAVRGASDTEFDIVSCPEFLKEGAAIEDFMRPDRVVIGTDNVRTAELMKELYAPFVRNGHPVYVMSIPSAELTKYAANAMLATRISFMNELARLCEKTGADIEEVRLGIGSDKRIGMSFLYAGAGYGGSCFPKDIKALIQTGRQNGTEFGILQAVEAVNQKQKIRLLEMVTDYFGKDLAHKTIAVWGLSFKPNTDDMREAPSIDIIKGLTALGAAIQAYDPAATSRAHMIFGRNPKIKYFENNYEALSGADAMVLVTEWHQFRRPDFVKIKKMLRQPVIFDGRNQYNPEKLRKLGFNYFCIGRIKNNASTT